jgi:hypothetical protein
MLSASRLSLAAAIKASVVKAPSSGTFNAIQALETARYSSM